MVRLASLHELPGQGVEHVLGSDRARHLQCQTFPAVRTLVGTYFGIKAGLDGQDKVREIVSRAIRGGAVPPRGRTRREDE